MNFNQPVKFELYKNFDTQRVYLTQVAHAYGFKDPLPNRDSKFAAWKVRLNEFCKGVDRLPMGPIDVLKGEQNYPEVNLHQKKAPKFECHFNHKDFV